MWATIIGLGCIGLAVVGVSISRDTRPVEVRDLVVYTQWPRQAQKGGHSPLQFSLDTTEADSNATVRQFDDVRIRFARATLQSFNISSISPKPDNQWDSGSGKYLIFSHLSRDESIRLGLRPRIVGPQRVVLSLYVRDFSPYEIRGLITVTPPQGKTVPN